MLKLAGVGESIVENIKLIESKIQSGEGLEKFREMVGCQGGNVSIIDEPEKLMTAQYKVPVTIGESGYVEKIEAKNIGQAVVNLGGGRVRKEDEIDHAVGIEVLKKIGDEVKEGDTLSLGSHTLTFAMAPMVHWPEVMVTYESSEKVLFSADGFGKFGALDREEAWDDEARRYYIGIVGKYGQMVQCLLKKASKLEISKILPLHGPVLSEDLGHYISLYDKWSSYTPEEDSVTIAYTSVYGHTREAVKLLEKKLSEKGVKFTTFDLARCDMSEAVASAFKTSKLVLATTTYNGDIFPFMREFVEHLTERNFQKRKVAIIENGSWGPMAAKVIIVLMEKSKDIEWLGTATLMSALNSASETQVENIAEALSK